MPKAANPLRAKASPIDRLLEIEASASVVISCYVRLLPEDRVRGNYLALVKQKVRALDSTLAGMNLSRDELASVRGDLESIVGWLGDAKNLPHAHGMALFASKGHRLFEVIPMMRVFRTRIEVADRPLLRELVDARDTLGRYLMVMLDRTRARLFEVTATKATEIASLTALASRGGKFRGDRRDAPGWGERDYHHRLEEERHRHYAEIAGEVARLAHATRFDGIALGGPTDHVQAFQPFLPDVIAHRVIGTARLNPTSATADDAHRTTWALVSQHGRAEQKAMVERMEEALPAGWAVNGPRDTLEALARGQLRTLLVSSPVAQIHGFRCRPSGQLVLSESECTGDGDADPVLNVVDQAIEEALRQRLNVTVIDDDQVGSRVVGLAGLLRFRVQADARLIAAANLG